MLHVYDTTNEVLCALADHFVKAANDAIAAQGQFTVALSGGSSPKKLYELLASDAYQQKIDWSKVYFFFGDERNALMAKTALFDTLHIADKQIFKVNTALSPEKAAEAYIADIHTFFKGGTATFDLVLLGLGDNSHTASLFPDTPILHDDTASVKQVWLEDQQVYRISFTYPLINQAKSIAFLVYGDGKAEAVHHVLKDATDIDEYPAQLIRKDADWFLDKAAAVLVQ
jgi:6-phosphogluconolactonase